MIIRMIIQGYLNYSITFLMGVQTLSFSNAFSIINSSIIVLFGVLSVGSLILSFIFLFRNRKELDNDHLSKRFSTLYDAVDTGRTFSYLMWILFMLRRFIIATIIVMFNDYPFLQVLINTLSSLVLLMYLIYV